MEKPTVIQMFFMFLFLVFVSTVLYNDIVREWEKNKADHLLNLKNSLEHEVEPTEQSSFVLENILTATEQPESGRDIFFIDTTYMKKRKMERPFTSRQACAVESAGEIILRPFPNFNEDFLFLARQNPYTNVFILFVSLNNNKKSTSFVPSKALTTVLRFKNVHVNYLDINEFAESSPLESFVKSGQLLNSKFIVSHTSDVVRLLVLWKYGGHYLDSDVIVKKSLDTFPSNSACDDTHDTVNGAVLNVDHSKTGRYWSEKFMLEMSQTYNGSNWGNNGPLLITRVLAKSCDTNVAAEMIKQKDCEGFHVLPHKLCYPISGLAWKQFFKKSSSEKALRAAQDSVVVHFWNNLSKKTTLNLNSPAAYVVLAKEFCPNVIAACKRVF